MSRTENTVVKKRNNILGVRPKDDPLPRIPAGNYEVQSFKVEKRPYLSGERKLYVHYRIIDGEYQGTELFCSYNFNYRAFPKGSKYYTDWSIANEGRPTRRDKMSPNIFRNKIFCVKVRDAEPKYGDGKPKPEMFHYSVVDRIEEKLAG